MNSHSRTRIPLRRSRGVALFVTVAALTLAGPGAIAQASGPTDAQYKDQVSQIAADFGGGAPTAPTSAPSGLQKEVVGGLPFTGLDAVALAAVAVALLSMGLALRRLTADRHV